MGLLSFLRAMALRRKQRLLVSSIENSSVRFSSSPGISLENPVVIHGAGSDIMGTMAVFAWLIMKRGIMNVDWRIQAKRGHHDGERHIDVYDIVSRSGVEETFYFDVTESFGKAFSDDAG